MSNTALHFEIVTEPAYLARDAASDVRHELVDGVVYAMAGGSDRHARIGGNLAAALNSHLPGHCVAYGSDMKLRIAHAEAADHYYPDVMVCCGASDQSQVWRDDPVLLAEVLSPSTERADRSEKLPAYTGIGTVEEVLLVAQDEMRVELFRRVTGWRREVLTGADTLNLTSVGMALPVSALYRRVEF